MKHLFSFLLLLTTAISGLAQQNSYFPGQALVRFESTANVQEFWKRFDASHSDFELDRLRNISPYMNIWKVTYKGNLEARQLVNELQQYSAVLTAQVNHRLKPRATTPNDPLFAQQWQWQNIAAENAWDITTGGLTANGDTIVVAIIDDGTQLNHPDLQANIWHNYAEIPGNGIDDDNNGYVDDFNGWHVINNNNNVNTGNHGVEVAGMIGAVGNNSNQGTGANWNVKLMTIGGGTAQEAEVIESYSYALAFRKKYNETNGAEGAFVVATNSSWGQDYGNPADAPLWCAFYDTLGVNGILSCAATSNASYNVDEQGDLPTGCTSEYLIAVTATDINDFRDFSAWGINSIDLGAPGDNIYTTAPGSSYTSTSGTSFASPLTAGVVALLYSAPCPNLISLAQTDPAAAALLVRDYIFGGVDTTAQLVQETKTGGRINAANSMQALMAQCGACVPPFSIEATDITTTSANIGFSSMNGDSAHLYYRAVGSAAWDTILWVSNPQALTGLTACTDYEVVMQSVCPDSLSNLSTPFTFKTDGCCLNPASFAVTGVTEAGATLAWSPVTAAQAYQIIYAKAPFTSWDTVTTTDLSITLALDTCTAYQAAIQTVCDNMPGFSAPVQFGTTGCGACMDLPYCDAASDDNTDEWIDTLAVTNVFTNPSGASASGYEFYPNMGIVFNPGQTYDMVVTPGYGGFPYTEGFRAWVDFNQNGSFEESELIVDPDFTITEKTTFTFTIPPGVPAGTTRMRTILQYSNLSSEPCGTMDYGEIEDYCVTIAEPTGCYPPFGISLSEPTASSITASFTSSADSVLLRYRIAGSSNWTQIGNITSPYVLSGLEGCTDYEIQLQSICGNTNSDWSNTLSFKTFGCGACLDYEYCEASANNPSYEWIDSLSITGVFENPSGDTELGYESFPDLDIVLTQGESYEMVLTPGYSSTTYDEYVRVWIDLNQDGILDDSTEAVIAPDTSINQTTAFPFTLPGDALPGLTRMRVSLNYSQFSLAPCGTYTFGQVEDYCITIAPSGYCLGPDSVMIDNIGYYSADVSWTAVDSSISYIVQYRPVGGDWEPATTTGNNYTLTNLEECTNYEVEVQAVCANGLGNKVSNTFKTNCIIGTHSIADGLEVEVMPNPFDDRLTVKVQGYDLRQFQVRLLDMTGRPVAIHSTMDAGQNSLVITPAAQLSQAVYLLQIRTKDRSAMVRVVKQ